MARPLQEKEKRSLEILWHVLVLGVGCYFVLLSHFGLDLSWMNDDGLMMINVGHNILTQHESIFRWILPTSTSLLEIIPSSIMSFFTTNTHYWLIGNVVFKIVWLYIASLYLGHLLKPNRQERLYIGLLIFTGLLLTASVQLHHDPLNLLLPVVSDDYIAYPQLLMPLTCLCLCLSHLSRHSRLKLAIIIIICFATSFTSLLFLSGFAAPFVAMVFFKKNVSAELKQLAFLVLISSFGGQLFFQGVATFLPEINPTPVVVNSLSRVIRYWLDPFQVSWLLSVVHFGSILAVFIRRFWFRNTLTPNAIIVYSFCLWLVLIAVVSSAFDHDLARHSDYVTTFHYQFCWFLPIVIVILSPPVWVSPLATVLLSLSTIPLWGMRPNFSAYFNPTATVLCLQNMIRKYDLHSGLGQYWLTRKIRFQSHWEIAMATFDDKYPGQISAYNDSLNYSKNQQFDYIVTKASSPFVPYDNRQQFTELFGTPDNTFTCGPLLGYIYRHHQLKGYSWPTK